MRAKVDLIKRELIPDEDSAASLVADPGYIETMDDETRAKRIETMERGEWEYVGVVATAVIRLYLPSHPDGHVTRFEVSSGGLWGVESDSGSEYLDSVYHEQHAELMEMLAALGFAREQGREAPHGLGHVLDTLEEAVTDSSSGADDAEAAYNALDATGRKVPA